jgi:hypothetical protein
VSGKRVGPGPIDSEGLHRGSKIVEKTNVCISSEGMLDESAAERNPLQNISRILAADRISQEAPKQVNPCTVQVASESLHSFTQLGEQRVTEVRALKSVS